MTRRNLHDHSALADVRLAGVSYGRCGSISQALAARGRGAYHQHPPRLR
jgi:hypothetical protein